MESVTTVEAPGARDTRAKSKSSRRGDDGWVLSTDALAAPTMRRVVRGDEEDDVHTRQVLRDNEQAICICLCLTK